jgi:threonine aldolase
MLVDLRSDTFTKPGPAMRAAMAEAEVGDDVWGEDPTIRALEERVAATFGHEAGLFVPSGSMGNQICLALVCEPGKEVLCDLDAHVVIYEMGTAAALNGLQTRTFPSLAGVPDPAQVLGMVRMPAPYAISTAAIALENTHNVAGGAILPLDVISAISAGARERNLLMHCDGARIWNAMVATGIDALTYGALFDTMSVCLSKGLGAPVGSVIVSSDDRIARARDLRKRMGGGMRQAGILAAGGLYALDHHLSELGRDHERARVLAAGLGGLIPDTNIVMIDVADSHALVSKAYDEGVLLSAFSPTRVRAVVHRDLGDEAIQRAVEVLAPLV